MLLSKVIFVLLNGLASGMAFFLVAVGLTWVFGILKILNMAHGAFFMIGSYLAFSLSGSNPSSIWVFVAAAALAAVAVGALGFLTSRIVFDRLRTVDYHYVLIATFGLMLFCEGIAKSIWGIDYYSVMPPPELDHPLRVGTAYISAYTVFVIAAGLVLYAGLDLVMYRTRVGKLLRAVANDPWMAGTLGINVPAVLTISVLTSFVLAGLAGGLLLPNQTLSIEVGSSYLLYSFLAVVIGGLGSIRGTFVACVLLGVVESANATFMASFGGIAIYVLLAAFLVWRPNGLVPMEAAAR